VLVRLRTHENPETRLAGLQPIADQTARAFAREMGITSTAQPRDDCTPAEFDCRIRGGSRWEVSDELFNALVLYQRALAVPARRLIPANCEGAALFDAVGCAACHRLALSTRAETGKGGTHPSTIDAFTDLRLHDQGVGLADHTASGRPITTRWRTAPLWGVGDRLASGRSQTFLHDGRARSLEEAVLWHAGEAAGARSAFERLIAPDRAVPLDWMATL
jgi:CxxC motif-containing protein (DUF1111 family)